MRRSFGFLVLCCLMLTPHAATAQEEPVIPLDSITVTATALQSTALITRVTEAEMDRQHVAVGYDALEYQPGLHVTQRLGLTGAGLTRLAIRGAGVSGPAGLIVYIDGRPDPTVTFAHPAPSAHSKAVLEVIEVIYGPSPVLHGSGNTGVVSYRSRIPGQGWSGRLTASGGSHGTTENFGVLNYGWARGFVSVDATYRSTEGYIDDTDAWVAGGKVRVGYQASDHWRLRASAGQNQDHFAVFGPFSVPGPFGNPGTTDLDLTQTVADLVIEGDYEGFDTSLQLWADWQEPRSQIPPEGAEIADVAEYGARLRGEASPWTGGHLTVGTDVLWAEARNRPALPPTAPEVDASITEAGPYVFLEQAVVPRLTLAGGVRLTQHSEYGSEPAGEAGLRFRLGTGSNDRLFQETLLLARVSRGFQSPTLQQLFGVFRGTVNGPPNPDLEPERVTQLEGGILQRYRLGTLRLGAYVQDGQDQIAPVMGELQNVGAFNHYGVEAGVQLRPVPELLVDVGVARNHFEDTVLRIPHNTLDFNLVYRPAALSSRGVVLSLYGRQASKTFDTGPDAENPIVRLDDYFVANLKLRAGVTTGMHVFLEVDNLTDEDYETVRGIPMPGRSLYVGVTAGW